jgi:hypothetical protein
MLDYAANGVVYWPLEQLRELFARQCERASADPEQVVAELAGEEADAAPVGRGLAVRRARRETRPGREPCGA